MPKVSQRSTKYLRSTSDKWTRTQFSFNVNLVDAFNVEVLTIINFKTKLMKHLSELKFLNESTKLSHMTQGLGLVAEGDRRECARY